MFKTISQKVKACKKSYLPATGAAASSSAFTPPSNHPYSPAPTQAAVDISLLPASSPEVSTRNIEQHQNYGIRELYNSGQNACVDIVFVHGLTGDSYDTWLHKKSGIHWPSHLLGQDIPGIRVLSFGFDADVVRFLGRESASNSRLTNHAESLVNNLVQEREQSEAEERKIIFVAHSLGGLITEQALTYSKTSAETHLKQVEHHTIGIAFLGVPHCGSDLEAWATIARKMVTIIKRTNKSILDVLNPNSEMLHQIEHNFHNNLRQRNHNPIQITGFFEELAVNGIGVASIATR